MALPREMSWEQYQDWREAKSEVAEVMEVAAEVGGPRLTMVPEAVNMPFAFCPDEVADPNAVSAPASGSAFDVPSDIAFHP